MAQRTHFRYALLFFFIISVFSSITVFSQLAGRRSFEFLNIPSSSRMAGLGGVNVSLADRDVNFFYANPASNGDSLKGAASVNYQFFVADIGHASITYGHDFPSVGFITAGVQHINYGDISGYDASGMETGNFSSQETALFVSKSHQVGNYRFGVSMKGIFSSIAGYGSNAIAIDVGGIFIHPKQQLTVGLVIKNIGAVLSDYSNTGNTRLPFDVQVGTTFKPEHMPFRFSVTGYNLVNIDILYDSPEFDDYSFLQNVFSHLNFGGEILVHKNVNVLVGYNYLNHQALKLENGGGGAGISVGFSVSIKMVDLVVSRSAYVAGNAAYSFTLSTNINRYFKRR